LADFYQTVGAAAYGTAWQPSFIKLLPKLDAEPVLVGSPRYLAREIRDQILLGLESGIIRAAVSLIVSELASNKPGIPTATNGDTQDEDEDEDELSPGPRLHFFAIDRAFWREPFSDAELDWEASSISLPSDQLRDLKGPKRSLSDRYDIGSNVSGVSVRIINSETAMRSCLGSRNCRTRLGSNGTKSIGNNL